MRDPDKYVWAERYHAPAPRGIVLAVVLTLAIASLAAWLWAVVPT